MNARSNAAGFYPLSVMRLFQENQRYQGTKAVSKGNRPDGFLPAFLDPDTNIVYPSRQADGRLAVIHCIEGLPDELVVSRDEAGHVAQAKPGLISGFLYGGRFYSREEALKLL